MRILVADDHELVRRGIISLLSTDPSLTVVGEAADGRDAVDKALSLKPDVIVMDISMPRLNGLEATREIKRALPLIEVVIVSQQEVPEMVRQAFAAGALGYVLKSSITPELLTAIQAVSHRQAFRDPAIRNLAGLPDHLDAKEILQRSVALENALRDSEELYRSTFELAAVGVAHIDPAGHWLRLNPKFCEILGYSCDELLRLSYSDIISQPGASSAQGTDASAQISAHPTPLGLQDSYSVEERYFRKDHSSVWVYLNVSTVRTPDGTPKYFIAVIEDISEHKRIEEELRRSEEQFRVFADSLPELCWMADAGGTIFWYNQRWYDYTGGTPEQMLGWGWQAWHDPKILPTVMEKWRASLQTEQPFEMVFPLRAANGEFRSFLTRVRPLHDQSGGVIRWFGVNTDITEQKLLRDELESHVNERTRQLEEKNIELTNQSQVVRRLSARLLQSQDDERRRIARELHDSAGQTLAAVQMHLAPLKQQAHTLGHNMEQRINESFELLDGLSKELRTISYLLHPPLLDETGLPSALRWYVQGFAERSKIAVELVLPEDLGRLTRETETTVFRLVQECLTNIHRHSGGAKAAIRLSRSPEEVCLQVTDNGKGMPGSLEPKSTERSHPGVGIQGMRERVRQLGGVFDIQSDEKGTTVTARFPAASFLDLSSSPDSAAGIQGTLQSAV